MTNINDLLAERAKTHGDFRQHAGCTQALKRMVSTWLDDKELADDQQEALDMILHKIGRIVAGNEDEPDHWRDIAGYATLVANRLELDAAAPKPMLTTAPIHEWATSLNSSDGGLDAEIADAVKMAAKLAPRINNEAENNG